jgi:ribosomal protein L35
MKTNKSYTKRLKVTGKGKVLSRKIGQNHFNAKKSRRKSLQKRSAVEVSIGKTTCLMRPLNGMMNPTALCAEVAVAASDTIKKY